MTDSVNSINQLVGKTLAGFQVKKIYDVCICNADGSYITSVAFFADLDSVNSYNKSGSYRFRKRYALTDGKVAFLFRGDPDPVVYDSCCVSAVQLSPSLQKTQHA